MKNEDAKVQEVEFREREQMLSWSEAPAGKGAQQLSVR